MRKFAINDKLKKTEELKRKLIQIKLEKREAIKERIMLKEEELKIREELILEIKLYIASAIYAPPAAINKYHETVKEYYEAVKEYYELLKLMFKDEQRMQKTEDEIQEILDKLNQLRTQEGIEIPGDWITSKGSKALH